MNDRLPPEPTDPYSSATAANTGSQWLDDMHKVDLSLDGMHDYAKNMAIFQKDLVDHWPKLQGKFADPARTAFGNAAFPEVQFVGLLSAHALGELATYMGYLTTGLLSVSYAAQTIADSYSSTDGWSAVDINAVDYAFVIKGGDKPRGLHIQNQGTVYDLMTKLSQEADKGGAPAPQGLGTPVGQPVVKDDGTVVVTYQAADGTITTVSSVTRDGQTVTTTSNKNQTSVTTSSTYSYPYGTITTSTTDTTDAKDPSKHTKSSETTSTYSNSGETIETTETRDDKGNVTNTRSTTTVYNSDGTVTVTKGGSGDEPTSTTYGPNPVIDKHPDDPGEDVLRATQGAMR